MLSSNTSFCLKKVYNVSKNTYEDINNTSVIDTLDVVTTELRNATSICLLLLSADGMVISESKDSSTPEL